MSIDLSIFYALYSLQGKSPFLDWGIIFLAQYLPILIAGVVLVWALMDFRAGKQENVYGYIRAFAIGIVGRVGVAELIRHFFHRLRPFAELQVSQLLQESSYSFPSGHSIFLFGLATGVFFINKRYGYWLYALSCIVGMARIAAGVHYPSDILGGAILGIALGYIVRIFWKTHKNKK